jgi:RNA polymerase sigma factor (sigma-70 family)
MDKEKEISLTEKTSNELIEIYRTHETEEVRLAARNEVIVRQTKNVEKAAWKHAKWKNSCGIDDLIQEGWRGVMKAVEKFEFEYEVPFEAYAYKWAEALVKYSIYSRGRTIRTPIPKIRDIAYLKSAMDAFKEAHGREPSVSEIRTLTGMSVKKIRKTLNNEISLFSTNQTTPNDSTVKEITLPSSITNPSKTCEHNDNVAIMKKLIESQLDNLEQKVLIDRHGLFGFKKKTLDEISQEIDYTRPGVRAVECRAVSKLKVAYGRFEDGCIKI